jgi:hypothetical protein
MPRPDYYNLRRTGERQAHIAHIAQQLGLGDGSEPNTWGKVIDFCLRSMRYLETEDKSSLLYFQDIDDSKD